MVFQWRVGLVAGAVGLSACSYEVSIPKNCSFEEGMVVSALEEITRRADGYYSMEKDGMLSLNECFYDLGEKFYTQLEGMTEEEERKIALYKPYTHLQYLQKLSDNPREEKISYSRLDMIFLKTEKECASLDINKDQYITEEDDVDDDLLIGCKDRVEYAAGKRKSRGMLFFMSLFR